jgi:hypothetical protein
LLLVAGIVFQRLLLRRFFLHRFRRSIAHDGFP